MDNYVKRATLHLVDKGNSTVILSENKLDLTKDFVAEYVLGKVDKITTPTTKNGVLEKESTLGKIMQSITKENFLDTNIDFIQAWSEIYLKAEDAPSSDVLNVFYEKDGAPHFAFLRLAYKEGVTHFVDNEKNGVENTLILNHAILPQLSSKADEAFSVNLNTLEYELVSKRYEFSGEKHNYFEAFLLTENEQPNASMDQNVRTVKKIAKSIGRKYEDDAYEVAALAKEALHDSFEEYGTIDSEFVSEKIFNDNISAKLEFQDALKQEIPKTQKEYPDVAEYSEKKLGKQKLSMDNGIELIVPLSVYRDSDLVEFINNPDGTISVVLKNIEKIVNK